MKKENKGKLLILKSKIMNLQSSHYPQSDLCYFLATVYLPHIYVCQLFIYSLSALCYLLPLASFFRTVHAQFRGRVDTQPVGVDHLPAIFAEPVPPEFNLCQRFADGN